MFDLLQEWFSNSYMPHGGCYLWNPTLIWLHVISDGMTAAAYFSIPVSLVYFVRQKEKISFNWIFWLFAAFIFWCGVTHILKIITIWEPLYWIEGGMSAITGLVSAVTAIALWPLIPRALRIPSPKELADTNTELKKEIQQRRKAEQELKELNEELEQKVEEKTSELRQFVYASSHDLSEPLRHIRGFIDILGGRLEQEFDAIPEDIQTPMNHVNEAADQMREMTDSLLRLSRVGREELSMEEISMNQCVEDVLTAFAEKIDEHNVDVEKDDLPDVPGNEELLRVLFQNLIDNAIKCSSHYGHGKANVMITVQEGDDEWVFGVKDNGVGIPEGQQDSVFQPFQRHQPSEEVQGSGIGLSICRKIVKRHGGTIWVESTSGEGAHFQFTIPCSLTDSREEP